MTSLIQLEDGLRTSVNPRPAHHGIGCEPKLLAIQAPSIRDGIGGVNKQDRMQVSVDLPLPKQESGRVVEELQQASRFGRRCDLVDDHARVPFVATDDKLDSIITGDRTVIFEWTVGRPEPQLMVDLKVNLLFVYFDYSSPHTFSFTHHRRFAATVVMKLRI